MWNCPACQSPLLRQASQWQCDNNHCYDIAKSGYVNLLLANQKSSSEPGDNKLMIDARRSFLQQLYYAPLLHALQELAGRLLEPAPQPEQIKLYDAGCGDGYYLHGLFSSLVESGVAVRAAANDISKYAVHVAAKKHAEIDFAVASNFKLPLPSDSQNILLQVFAPSSNGEVLRVLTKGGFWIRVGPGARHLNQLKQVLYESAEEHRLDGSIPQGFVEFESASLSFDFLIDDEETRKQLLMMTPFYWAVSEGKMPLVLAAMTKLTADFAIRVLQKKP